MAKKKTQIKKNPNLKWLFVIVTIILLISAFIFYKNYNQNPQEADTSNVSVSTTDWKIYADSTNGFTIKYPKNWIYKEINNEGGQIDGGAIILPDYSVRFYDSSKTPTVAVWPRTGNELLYLRIEENETIEEIEKSKGIKQTTIAGKPAVKYSTGAYVELSSNPNAILSISSTSYPSSEMEEILNSLVISK